MLVTLRAFPFKSNVSGEDQSGVRNSFALNGSGLTWPGKSLLAMTNTLAYLLKRLNDKKILPLGQVSTN